MLLAKLKKEGRLFWSGQAYIDPLNYLLSLTINYYKSVYHLIPTLSVGIGSTLLPMLKIN